MRFFVGYIWDSNNAEDDQWSRMVSLWDDSTDDALLELVNEFGFPYGVDERQNATFDVEGESPWGTADRVKDIQYGDGHAFVAHNPGMGYFAFYWSEESPFA